MKRGTARSILLMLSLAFLPALAVAAQPAPFSPPGDERLSAPAGAPSAEALEREDADLASHGIPTYGLTREERREMQSLFLRKEAGALAGEELGRLSDLISQSAEPAALPGAEAIGTGTYPFTSSSVAALEDMSSGTTALIGVNADDTASAVADIGFDFWFDGVRCRHFSVNANGLMRLGTQEISSFFTNDLTSTSDLPRVAPYWDDLYVGTNGKVHFKVVGTAPNRKLVVEWLNMQIPCVGPGNLGAGTFQAWLYETTGVIEFVYGPGIALNNANGGYSIGFGSSATAFASVTSSTPSVAYGTANNTQTDAIASGTKYTFTPPTPAAPSNLTFTSVTATSMTLDWADNSSDEVGFAIYRSTNGGATWDFIAQTAAGATSSFQIGLNAATGYSWAVYAVTEGGVSTAVVGSQASTGGTMSGAFAVGPAGAYPSLTAAFAAIGAAGIAGPITLELQGTYSFTAETYPIMISNATTSATYSITIRPQIGAVGLAITSADATATIDLNGAANVTIDGRPGGIPGPSQLTIANTTTTGAAVRFINDAIGNAILYTTLQGVNTSSNGGVVFFSSTAGVLGNDNNTIANCDIRDGATTPANLLYSAGSAVATDQFNSANSGNVVQSNNIYNFDWDGVKLAAGNTNWTITGNSFYQSAARTGTGLMAVRVDTVGPSTNEGTTITNNFIGGSSPGAAGTPFTLSGFSSFVGIDLNHLGGTPANVNGNTIANFSLTTTYATTTMPGIWCGIYVGSGYAAIGTAAGNTIGSGTGTNSIRTDTNGGAAVTVGIGIWGAAGALIANNTVGSITTAGNVSYPESFAGIWTRASGRHVVVSNNLVGSLSTANSIYGNGSNSTTGQTVTGILSSGTFAQISGNTVANVTNAYYSTGTAGQVLGIATSSGTNLVVGNTVRNLSTASANPGTGTSASAIGISQTSATAYQVISQNVVHSLASSAASAAVNSVGIAYTGATTGTNLITRNFVHSSNLATTNTAAGITGIYIASGNSVCQNNMVRLGLNAAGASITKGLSICGINEAGGTNNLYFNTVYVGGTGVASASSTTALQRGTATADDYRDNILVNARSNASGAAPNYALSVASTTGLTSSTCSYNVLYTPGAGGSTGGVGGASYASLSAWRSATGFDGYSNAGNPNLVLPSGTAAMVDLHLTGTSTAEQAGQAIPSVTDDFDGESRASLTPTDVGADAGNYIRVDLAGPMITYLPLANTTSTSNRALANVTITDASGVDTTPGTMPRVYFKRSTDGNLWNDNTSATDGWKFAEANGTTSPFDFTIDYSLLSGGTGVADGTVVQYFVVAQDLAAPPNVGIISGAFAATPPSVALAGAAFPIGGAINSFTVSTTLSGAYTVPGSFPSLTNPGGIFEAINAGFLGGSVEVDITADLNAESGTVPLNPWTEVGSGNYTLLIKPSGAPRTIAGDGTGAAVIKLNGADRVTIDGALSGGTDRSLTITNPNGAASSAVIWIASASTSDGATNDAIKNCVLSGQASTTTAYAVFAGSGETLGNPADAPNSGNTVRGNVISRAQNGVYINGNAESLDQNWVISGNVIGSAATSDKMSFRGLYLANAKYFAITSNTILGVLSTASSSSTMSGIQVGGMVWVGTISRNVISDIKQVNETGWGSNGLFLAATTMASDLDVFNNFIFDVASYGHAGFTYQDNGYGIMIQTGGGYRLYNNSVQMTADQISEDGIPAAINVSSSITGSGALDLRDNIFATVQTVGTRYVICCAAAKSVFQCIDYNDYFPGTGFLGYMSGVRSTLGQWRAVTAQDAHSIMADPLFLSAANLHLQPCPAVSPAIGAAIPIGAVTADIDGQPRSPNTPDIGADETPRFTIASSAGSGGSIAPSGDVPVPCGASRPFTITPAEGYAILDVLVDGSSIGPVPAYTFVGVTGNRTIDATFGTGGSAPGSVPDRVTLGTPLTVVRNAASPAHLDLAWGDSCGAGQTDFAVYQGTIGSWYSHAMLLCSTGGAATASDVTPAAGDSYYLIVPVSATSEGSYGTDSSGAEIPQGSSPCFATQDLRACPARSNHPRGTFFEAFH